MSEVSNYESGFTLNSLNPKKDKKEVKLVLEDIVKNLHSTNTSPEELSMTMDKVSLKGQLLDNLNENDQKVLDILKALANKSQDKGNLNHIKRFIKATYIETTSSNGKPNISVVNKPFKEALIDFEKYINANPSLVTPEFKAYLSSEIIKIRKV